VTQFVGEIRVTNVDLINIFNHTNPPNNRQRFSVLAGTFNPERAAYDPTVVLLHPGEQKANNFSGYTGSNLFNFLYWPKEVRQVPRSVFGHDAILHPDGSTTLQKTAGSVYVSDVRNIQFPATYDIGAPLIPNPIPPSVMYHSGVWFQASGAIGGDDMVTCRVELSNTGAVVRAELVSLEQPLDGVRGRWTIEVLKENACDTNLAYAKLRSGGILSDYDVVYATGFHTRKLVMYWTEARNWLQDPEQLQHRDLATGAQFYDVTVYDMNRNGNPNLLVTTAAQTGGTVEVWDIPNDFRTVAQYNRRVIASGFTSRNGGVNGRSPKIARPFYPTSNTARKPWIMVAGGDDGRAYYLRPISEAVANFEYTLVTVADHGPNQHVGGMAAADIDGDGFTELFVSVRNKHVVEVYSFRAELDAFVRTN